MLFYERVVKEDVAAEQSASVSSPIDEPLPSPKYKFATLLSSRIRISSATITSGECPTACHMII